MRLTFLCVLVFVSSLNGWSNEIEGKIGKYPILIEIQSVDWTSGDILGRYRYKNKESYLSLEGNLMHQIVWLEESYKNEVTGHFYMVIENATLKGKWIADKKWLNAEVYLSKKAIKQLKSKSLNDYQKEVSNHVSGGYANENYFINDMWFRDDNPQLEVGFNGGALVLEQVHEDSLAFWVNTVSGPTYHIAYASGVATKNDNGQYEYLVEAYEGDSCIVYIEMEPKEAHVWAKGNFLCGFGARAYLDHRFIKITDEFKFDEEEISIQMMKNTRN
ncbi:MAG: hypothetical protein ACPG21_07185 [Crocinitomicaceae bacterium]